VSVAVELTASRVGWDALGDAIAEACESGFLVTLVGDAVRVVARDADAANGRLAGSWVGALRAIGPDVRRLLLDAPTLVVELRRVDPLAWEAWGERVAILCADGMPTDVAERVALCWHLSKLTTGQLVRVLPLGLLAVRAI
jgi:hypothetical protein